MPNAHLFTKQTPAFEIDRCFQSEINISIYIQSPTAWHIAQNEQTHRAGSSLEKRNNKKVRMCAHIHLQVFDDVHTRFVVHALVTLVTATNVAVKVSFFFCFAFTSSLSPPLPFWWKKQFQCFPSQIRECVIVCLRARRIPVPLNTVQEFDFIILSWEQKI